VPVLDDVLMEGDLVLTMGAGDIGGFAAGLPTRLSSQSSNAPHLKVQK
jgi:UDP-N-acetylmuramate-alanine ligase